MKTEDVVKLTNKLIKETNGETQKYKDIILCCYNELIKNMAEDESILDELTTFLPRAVILDAVRTWYLYDNEAILLDEQGIELDEIIDLELFEIMD